MEIASNRSYDVDESRKKGRKWLDRELRKLDPETQYEEIISLFAQYSLDMFSLHYTVMAGTMHNIQPRTGAETLAYTNKIVRRPMRRNEDGLAFFWTWFGMGPSHPTAKASIARLNDIHLKVAKSLPGNFSHNDEFIYTLCMIGIFNYKLFKKLGLADMPEYLQIAMHHELRDISNQMVTEDGTPLHTFPKDFQGLVDFAKEFDSRDHGPATQAHRDVSNAMINDFATRWFPRRMQWFGRNMMLYAAEDHIIDRYGLKKLNAVERFITHWMMKTMFWLKMSVAPDTKVSFLDTWKPLTNDEVRAADKVAAERADAAGLIKGGKNTLAVTRPGEAAPMAKAG